ncbi:MAG: SprT family zinc-dependent metalloprotease [Pseudomonadota bacterium]
MLNQLASLPDYTVRVHHRAKRLLLKITPFGEIEVVVPKRFNKRLVPEFVATHRDWIEKNLAKLAQRHVNNPGGYAAIPTEIPLRAIGITVNVQRTETNSPTPTLHFDRNANTLHLNTSDPEIAGRLLQRWLNGVGKDILVPWIHGVSKELELPFDRATVRLQRSRWGSCSVLRHINLNHNLLFVPSELVRYLFIHELCHTRHMDHSATYWQLVASIEPRYQILERELYRATEWVPLWAFRKF